MRALPTPAKVAIVGGLSAALLGMGAAMAWAQNSSTDAKSTTSSQSAHRDDASVALDSTKAREDLGSRLDKAVTDGKITSKDKDAVLKAFNADVFGGEEMAIELGEGGPGPFGGFRDDSK